MPALSATARQEYYAELGNALPPPVDHTRENHERRLNTAIEAFEALRPGDAYEARLAVQIVLTGAHATDSLREAGVYREDFAKMTRCRAQAASMMREERAAKRMLAQEQKVRLAGEAVAAPAPAALPGPIAANPAPQPVAAASAPPPSPEAIAQAEAFANEDIVAAVRIRNDRGVTPQNKESLRHVTLPTDPAVIDALVRGTSDLLTVLDEVGGGTLDAAA